MQKEAVVFKIEVVASFRSRQEKEW